MKPNLFIVGAAKCGTTAWVEYLGDHRDVYFPDIKEPHYFAHDFPKKRLASSLEEYEELFAPAGDAKVLGEGSVMYLYSKVAAQAIRDYNPDAKILIFLREQEDFLPSLHHQYLWMFSENIEDFERAWRLSGKRAPESISKHCPDYKQLDYMEIAKFHEQVERYFDLFPHEQIRVFRFRDWTKDPRGTYLEILDFLGLEDDGRTEFEPVNEAKAHRIAWLGRMIVRPPRFAEAAVRLLRKLTGRQSLRIADRASRLLAARGYRTKVRPELREEIRGFYAEDNRRLEELLSSAGQAR